MTTAYILSHTYSSDDFTDEVDMDMCDAEDLYSDMEYLFD